MRKNNIEDIIVLPHFQLTRLKNYPDYYDLFIEKVTTSIEQYYDEITPDFARNLLNIEIEGRDPNGFFTMGKDIWVAISNDDNRIIGFEVITRKRGGSIKLGPTYMEKDIRNHGYASEMIDGLIGVYKSCGFRKIYVTAPLSHKSTAVLDYCKLKFKLEAILCKHYAVNSSDRVCGLVFDNAASEKSLCLRIDSGERLITQYSRDLEKSIDVALFSTFIIQNMKEYFSDIDKNFVKSILNGIQTGICNQYEKKGKCVIFGWHNEQLVATVVATKKRGGVLKIVPFLIEDEYVNRINVSQILKEIDKVVKENSRKKITIFIPVTDIVVSNLISENGYVAEGILREPYKREIDVIVFSKFIQ